MVSARKLMIFCTVLLSPQKPVEYHTASIFEQFYKLLPMFRIGPYKLSNHVVLAPMAGVSDLPFRRLCLELGAGMAIGEMVSSNPQLRNTRKTLLRGRHDGEAGLRSVQIAGSDPAEMAAAAQYHVARGAQIIDIKQCTLIGTVIKTFAEVLEEVAPALRNEILFKVKERAYLPGNEVTVPIRVLEEGESDG